MLDSTARYLKAGDPLLRRTARRRDRDRRAPAAGSTSSRLTPYDEVLWYANAPTRSTSHDPAGRRHAGYPAAASRSLTVAAHSGTDLPGTYARAQTAVPGRLDRRRHPARHPGRHPGRAARRRSPWPGRPRPRRDGHPGARRGRERQRHRRHRDARRRIGRGDHRAAGPDQPAGTLQAPLRLLWDLVTVTRGASVRDEVLGTGDAQRAGQDFTLAKSPVTYLADDARPVRRRLLQHRRADRRRAVLDRGADAVRARPDEAIFVTYEDDDGKTHVRIGDGETGRPAAHRRDGDRRLPRRLRRRRPGRRARCRRSSTAVPNLRSVRNPVPPAGGADPDPPETLRRLAPRSVLTFGRAISGDDYAAVAAAAPGVTRAAASWAWDPAEQRPIVRVYVGDDAGAVASARTALRAQADPNRPLVVVPAIACPTVLRVALELDPAYVPAGVLTEVRPPSWTRPAGCSRPGCSAWARRSTAAGSRRPRAPSPACSRPTTC